MVSIIAFDWLWNGNSPADFFVLENYNLRLYKVDEDRFILKEITLVQCDFKNAWFEVRKGIISLC